MLSPKMYYSPTGLTLSKNFESCELKAYKKAGDVWTIGWGHTGKEVVEDLVWTQEQADYWLMYDIGIATRTVNSLVNISLTQNEFDALVDFTYNLGEHNFATSSLLKFLNQGFRDSAVAQFPLWDKLNHKPLKGLYARRIAEQTLFLSGDNVDIHKIIIYARLASDAKFSATAPTTIHSA